MAIVTPLYVCGGEAKFHDLFFCTKLNSQDGQFGVWVGGDTECRCVAKP